MKQQSNTNFPFFSSQLKSIKDLIQPVCVKVDYRNLVKSQQEKKRNINQQELQTQRIQSSKPIITKPQQQQCEQYINQQQNLLYNFNITIPCQNTQQADQNKLKIQNKINYLKSANQQVPYWQLQQYKQSANAQNQNKFIDQDQKRKQLEREQINNSLLYHSQIKNYVDSQRETQENLKLGIYNEYSFESSNQQENTATKNGFESENFNGQQYNSSTVDISQKSSFSFRQNSNADFQKLDTGQFQSTVNLMRVQSIRGSLNPHSHTSSQNSIQLVNKEPNHINQEQVKQMIVNGFSAISMAGIDIFQQFLQ